MPRQPTQRPRELTGKHVLIAIVSFFAVLIIVNGIFITAAVGSFRGEDVKRSYRQGLDYNSVITDRREQAALGWSAFVEVEENEGSQGAETSKRIFVRVTDSEGRNVRGAEFEGRLRHPVDTALDITLTFTGEVPAMAIAQLPAGRWTLEAKASRDSDAFSFRKDLVLK